jgi:hypothetical protein
LDILRQSNESGNFDASVATNAVILAGLGLLNEQTNL